MSSSAQVLLEAQTRAATVRPAVGGFPHLAEALHRAGVRTHRFTVPAGSGLFVMEHGDVVQQGPPVVEGTLEVPPWSRTAVIAAIRADQAGHTTFPEFVRACWDAGVTHFDIDFAARSCTYHGARQGELYLEHYPEVALPEPRRRSSGHTSA